jgi:hypothetical protein
MKIVLLPRKEFEFTLESGEKIEGKHGTWSTKRLCDKKGWSILEFMVRFSDTEKLTLDDMCQLLLCAVEYKWRKDKKGSFPYTDIDACEWLEEMGGFGSEDWNKLLNHFASDLEEKKNQPETVS